MLRRFALTLALVACGTPAAPPAVPKTDADADPDGPHREAVATIARPYLDAELVNGLVIGLYDAGKREIYGFGAGPGGRPPGGHTLYELGSVTKVYTGLLLADAVQRKEVELDTAVAELLPAGVTVPTRDRVAITLRHLMLDSSGLPALPPSIRDLRDPFAKYDEDTLYRDLIQSELSAKPGTQISYSNLGAGLLGFALGRKIGVGYPKALETRIATPLGLRDTFVVVPEGAAARRAAGTDDELKPAGYWSWDALAGAGGVVSSMHDLLQLVDAELDAAAGGKAAPLRNPMRLTQEGQLSNVGANLGLGWIIDDVGRYWSSGTTGGFRSFVGFDPKTKRAVAVLASTAATLVDRIPPVLFQLLDGNPAKPWTPPTAEQLASFAGAYQLNGQKLTVVAEGKRLYLEAKDEQRRRLAPVSDHEFWLDAGNAVAIFKSENGKVSSIVFGVGSQQFVAARTE